MFRQGDVLLIVGTLPPGARLESRGPVILAYGEATGHAHRVEATDAALYRHQSGTYLVLGSPAEVRHQEHGVIVLPQGTYSVIRQREYQPTEIRQVAD